MKKSRKNLDLLSLKTSFVEKKSDILPYSVSKQKDVTTNPLMRCAKELHFLNKRTQGTLVAYLRMSVHKVREKIIQPIKQL